MKLQYFLIVTYIYLLSYTSWKYMFPKNHRCTSWQYVFPKNHRGTSRQYMFPKNHRGTSWQYVFPKIHRGTSWQYVFPKNHRGTSYYVVIYSVNVCINLNTSVISPRVNICSTFQKKSKYLYLYMVPLNRSMFNKSFTQKYRIKKLIPLLHYWKGI